MTAMAQVSARKPFRLSRYKPNEFTKRSQPTEPVVQPSGGSRQKQPFDPSELSRRLEAYQQDLKIAKAKRLAQEKSWESASETDRKDSSQGEGDKQDPRNVETVEEEVVVIADPERVERPESIRQLSRPNARRVSSARARRNPPGTYLPRYAAKQLSATTTPLQITPLKGARKAEGARKSEGPATGGDDASDVSPPIQATQEKKILDGTSIPKSIGRVVASESDINTFMDRGRSVMLPSTTSTSHSFSPRTTQPRPLSTALENMSIVDDDNQESNPYMLQKPRHQEQNGLTDHTDADRHAPKDHRPVLKDLNRHDWSQASQCGDSARQSLHLSNFWRKDHGSEISRHAQPQGGAKQRGKSQGDLSENHTMIADAVKLVKQERRRSSLIGFLKRHH